MVSEDKPGMFNLRHVGGEAMVITFMRTAIRGRRAILEAGERTSSPLRVKGSPSGK